MPTYLSPGVYVEEIPAATAPISGVGTAIAGFAGFAPMGPFNAPTMVTNWQQYVSAFGEFTEEFALAKAVYGFFNNGGAVHTSFACLIQAMAMHHHRRFPSQHCQPRMPRAPRPSRSGHLMQMLARSPSRPPHHPVTSRHRVPSIFPYQLPGR